MFRFRTVIFISVLVLFLVAPASLQAQHRDGSGTTSGAAVRSSPARPLTSIIGRPVAPFLNPPVTGFGRAPAFGTPVIGTSRVFPRSRGVVALPAFIPTFGFGGYGYYPYNYYPPYPGVPDAITQGYGYGQGPYAPDLGDAAAGQNQADLNYEVGRLSQEVDDLRQQQAMQAAPPPQPVTPAPVNTAPTVLVFRDGHRTEIQNYAVIGQTLWILDQGASTKFPLSDVDLEATQRENAARGMRFSVSSR